LSESQDPDRAHWAQAEAATALGDQVVPDPEQVWLSRFRDRTLLVLAVVAHAHGLTAREIRRSTARLPGSTRWSLRLLRRAGLVERARRAGPDHWFATPRGIRLGVTPYVTRLLAAAKPLWKGWWGAWSVGRFRNVGTTHGPPIFSPAYALADVHDPAELGEVIRTGTHDDRAFALTKLIALNDPASVPVLRELAGERGDEEPLARRAAVALGHVDTPASRSTLIEIAAKRDSLMREAAARSLGRLRATEALPTLVELVGFPSAPVRVAAIGALERIGEASAADDIGPALADSHRDVRRRARHALVGLGDSERLLRNPHRIWPLRKVDGMRARRHQR
jgi:HEAT repeat protein